MYAIGIDACGYIHGSFSLPVRILLWSDGSRKGHVGVLTCKVGPGLLDGIAYLYPQSLCMCT